ncbi:MAG: hypothetical protein MUC49_00575 [Raineya sp.]|jgi:hypothetical protein|nr:hypothetical protein [Raineya sp.]
MEKYLIALCFFFSYHLAMAQQKTIDFLIEHEKYIVLAEKVKEKLEVSDTQFSFQLVLYGKDNLMIEWTQTSPHSNTSIHLRFMRQPAIFEFVCDKSIKEDKQKSIESFIRHFLQNFSLLNSPLLKKYQDKEIINYLNKIDIIAKNGYACSSGDDYQAGLYSEIIISDVYLRLNQINWWNAKSLDRNNYCMRKLVFLIPVQDNKSLLSEILKKEFLNTYSYQDMVAGFEDHSAPDYRTCGQAILKALQDEFR